MNIDFDIGPDYRLHWDGQHMVFAADVSRKVLTIDEAMTLRDSLESCLLMKKEQQARIDSPRAATKKENMNTTAQKPTIGRIVHYWVLNSEECQQAPNPAIITHVFSDGTVNLQVFGDMPDEAAGVGTSMRRGVSESTDGRSGTWCWPPRT